MIAKPLLLHALTPLHAGTGQGVGIIDLPIAREKATGLPYVPGSSLKGPLKDRSAAGPKIKSAVFGTQENAGAAQFADARLLLLPVRSLRGTFAWVTSPYVLQRFAVDLQLCQQQRPCNIPSPTENAASVANESIITLNMAAEGTNDSKLPYVVFEDLDIRAHTDEKVTGWGNWLGGKLFPDDADAQRGLRERLCVLHDDVFSFLMQTATEVTARICLQEDSKTVDNLWYEEALPAESVLAAVVHAVPLKAHDLTAAAVLELARPVAVAQLGGKATVGRGLCRLQWG